MTVALDISLPEVLRTIYIERATGSVAPGPGKPTLHFQEGELYIAEDHPLGAALAHVCGQVPSGQRCADSPAMVKLVDGLAQELAAVKVAPFNGGNDQFPAKLAGPMATVLLVMDLAVRGVDEETLERRLGGDDQPYQSDMNSPAMSQLPNLDPELAQVLMHLGSPTAVSQVVRLSGGRRKDSLCALARMRSIALIRPIDPPAAQAPVRSVRRSTPSAGGAATEAPNEAATPSTVRPGAAPNTRDEVLVNARMLELFSDRIADDLDARPLELPNDEHRQRLAQTLGQLDSLDHYRLLGLEPTAAEGDIHAAFQELARVVHPNHATSLGMAEFDSALKLLFERATEAYLVLSEPRRRASYNLLQGIEFHQEVDPEKRQEEKRSLAHTHYRSALYYISERAMDYSRAVDLLQEAVRLDPQPQYYALLAQAQARNPHWQNRAAEDFEKAIELSPEDAGLRVSYGQLLETIEQIPKAREQYQKALELMPGHPAATEALERLGGTSRLVDTQTVLTDRLKGLFGGK